MATRQALQVTNEGIQPDAHAADSGGDSVTPDSIIRVTNGGASPITMTIVTPGTVSGLAIEDREVTIPDGETRYVRLPGRLYRDPETGLVNITWSETTSVEFEVIR